MSADGVASCLALLERGAQKFAAQQKARSELQSALRQMRHVPRPGATVAKYKYWAAAEIERAVELSRAMTVQQVADELGRPYWSTVWHLKQVRNGDAKLSPTARASTPHT